MQPLGLARSAIRCNHALISVDGHVRAPMLGWSKTIWMASYCPQWFGALGKTPARYLYYKDIHRDALQR